jgi:hypothetical protein
MKLPAMAIIGVLVMTPVALAGNIYGTISDGAKPLPQGVKIEVTCGANKYEGTTDASGAYKMFVKDQGRCVLTLAYQGQSPSLAINSYEGSVQYDLVLEKQGTQFALKRK